MSKLIGNPLSKNVLDEIIENTREANAEFLKEIEKERLEAERKAREEAEREAKPKKEKPLIHLPSKPMITEPADGDIVRFCGMKDLLKNDYEVLKDVYRNTFFTAEGEYISGKIRIEDKRVVEIRATERNMLELPESISGLGKLEDLYFGANKITSLPKSLETMDWLKNAYFHHNPLDDRSKKMLDRMRKKGIEAGYSEWM